MTETDVIFGTVVTLGFCVQVFNYWMLGQGRLNRYTWLFVLGCFIVSESMIAWHRPIYVLYVFLNLWGVYNLWRKP